MEFGHLGRIGLLQSVYVGSAHTKAMQRGKGGAASNYAASLHDRVEAYATAAMIKEKALQTAIQSAYEETANVTAMVEHVILLGTNLANESYTAEQLQIVTDRYNDFVARINALGSHSVNAALVGAGNETVALNANNAATQQATLQNLETLEQRLQLAYWESATQERTAELKGDLSGDAVAKEGKLFQELASAALLELIGKGEEVSLVHRFLSVEGVSRHLAEEEMNTLPLNLQEISLFALHNAEVTRAAVASYREDFQGILSASDLLA